MMKRLQYNELFTMTWKDVQRDFLASVVVFLVALPLCMGIAIATSSGDGHPFVVCTRPRPLHHSSQGVFE